MFSNIGVVQRSYFSKDASNGITPGDNSNDLATSVLRNGKTFLTLNQLKSICGGEHPFDYAKIKGMELDGGGKSVYAVEFPAGSKLTGKWAVKLWDGDPADSKERLENELLARLVAKHMCNHSGLIFTEAYGSDDGKGSYIIASRFLDGFKDVEGELRQCTDLNLRAQLYAFGEIAPISEFHLNGMKTNGTQFGLYDLEPFNWKKDEKSEVSEPGKLNTNKAICTFAKKRNDVQFDNELKSVVSQWQARINSPRFQRFLSDEFQSKIGLSAADADQVVRVLHKRTSLFAAHVGLTP